MKISFQYPARVLTGYYDRYPAEVYEYDDRGRYVRNYKAGAAVYFKPVYGVRLQTAVVFDRELFIARRIKGAGRLALLAAAVAIVIPVAVAGLAFEWAAKRVEEAAEAAIDWLEDHTGFAPGSTVGEAFRINWKDIVS